MKKILLAITLYAVSCFNFAADNYSIFLVRHAEKLKDSKNPGLTACGKTRAQQLASLLSQANVKTIYSTSYQRTMQTATPLANQQKKAIKNYNPRHLAQFALQLKQKKENALVVGHSNTTPMLVSLLINKKVAPLTEQDYQYLYQVQLTNDQAILTTFKQPLKCDASQVN